MFGQELVRVGGVITGRAVFGQKRIEVSQRDQNLLLPFDFRLENDVWNFRIVQKGEKVLVVNTAGYGGNQLGRKQDIGAETGGSPGRLPVSMEQIAGNKDGFSLCKREAVRTDLDFHRAACNREKFRIRVPVQRNRLLAPLRKIVHTVLDRE